MAMPLLRRFRGLYVRIALVAIAASIVAVAAVYLLVVPPLKGDLERQRLGQLDQQARSPFSIGLLTDQTRWSARARARSPPCSLSGTRPAPAYPSGR